MYFFFFFFNDTATTEIYTLSLHDALPILLIGSPPYSTLFPTQNNASLQAPAHSHAAKHPDHTVLRTWRELALSRSDWLAEPAGYSCMLKTQRELLVAHGLPEYREEPLPGSAPSECSRRQGCLCRSFAGIGRHTAPMFRGCSRGYQGSREKTADLGYRARQGAGGNTARRGP